jgi:hypothetical protein
MLTLLYEGMYVVKLKFTIFAGEYIEKVLTADKLKRLRYLAAITDRGQDRQPYCPRS